MHNVSAVQKKIAAARKAISQGRDDLAWMMSDVNDTYIREFPEQAFSTFDEFAMAVDVLGILVEYYVHEGKKSEAINPLHGLSRFVDEVVANAPFTDALSAGL